MNWTREALENAFAHHQAVVARCGATGDWTPYADLFTEDVVYVEHHFGTMHGRAEVRAWITSTMSAFPATEMPFFPAEWHIVDVDRGWVVFYAWNRMRDPGDGSIHQVGGISLLKYAGDGRWSGQEDVYNPRLFRPMVEAWLRRRAELART